MVNFFTKLAERSKLQAAILILAIVILNKYLNLGLDTRELMASISGLVAYILGEAYKDAHNTTPPDTKKEPAN